MLSLPAGLRRLLPPALIAAVAVVLAFAFVLPASGQPVSEGAPADGFEGLPPGTSVETLLTNMDKPIAMAFDPDGRLFYTEKNTGNVRLFANGVLQPTPVIRFVVASRGEKGLLGIAIDPNFRTNRYIYVFYTCDTEGGCFEIENKVVRFT